MKTAKLLFCCVCSVLFLTQCTDDDLLSDLNTLSNRVENMEATVNSLNENLEALQVLLQSNKTIRDWSVKDGVYTLILSDNTEITLTQGKVGEVQIPEIAIGEDGCWVINGTSSGVKADGNTPRFRISDAGYWEVCTDDSGTYTQVLDVNGNPVKATSDEGGSGNTFFENVEVVDGNLVVTMTGGISYTLPIVEDLVAEIVTEGDDFEGETWFVTWGATVETAVRVKGDNYFVTAPAGWTASVSEPDVDGNAVLTVTAPLQSAGTRAVADNSSDLVLQVNKGVSWAVDKISVRGSIVANTPLEKFEAGRTLYINGLAINKEKFPVYRHVTADLELSKEVSTGVYFLDEDVTLTMKGSWNFGYERLIVIGNAGDKSATVKFGHGDADNLICNGNDASDHYFAFSNVRIDHLGTEKSYLYLNNGDGPFWFAFENCDIELATNMILTFYNAKLRKCALTVKDCRIHLTDQCSNIFGDGNDAPALTEFSMENCVFWSSEIRTIKLLNAPSAEAGSLTMKNNTFYNVVPVDNDAYLKVNRVNTSYICTDNIFCYAGTPAGNLVILNPANYGDLDGSLAGEISGNIGYKDGGEKTWQDVWYGAKPVGTIVPMVNLTGSANSPFESVDVENGVFTPKAEYADKGASL